MRALDYLDEWRAVRWDRKNRERCARGEHDFYAYDSGTVARWCSYCFDAENPSWATDRTPG